LLVVSFAGHGFKTGGKYYFAPFGCDFAKPEDTALDWAQIVGALAQVRCEVLLLIDTCRAGGAISDSESSRGYSLENEMTAEAVHSELYTIAACRDYEESYEWPEFCHGFFTYVILQALAGKYKTGFGNSIFLMDLRDAAEGQLRDLVKDKLKNAHRQTGLTYPPTYWKDAGLVERMETSMKVAVLKEMAKPVAGPDH
jgi:uncharacterized caspase-like protein